MHRPSHLRIAVLAVAAPLLLAPPLRHLLEASMALHMLLELPLLLAVGWAAASLGPRAVDGASRWESLQADMSATSHLALRAASRQAFTDHPVLYQRADCVANAAKRGLLRVPSH